MPRRLLAPAAMATMLCLTTAAVPTQTWAQAAGGTPGTMNAEQGWSSVARCAQEESERARHTCLDRVLREAGLLTSEMHARQQRRAFGLDQNKTAPATTQPAPAVPAKEPAQKPSVAGRLAEPAPVVSPSPTPSPSASRPAIEGSSTTSASSPAATTSAPPVQADRLEVELAKVDKAVNGRVFVTTTDGAVWVQTESVEMPQPPVAGDRMSIRKGSMGGYRCSVATTRLTYRCARSR